jgi:hypothetical protein
LKNMHESEQLAADIARRCRGYDPVQLLTALAWTNLVLPSADGHPAMIEYVHHLILCGSSPEETHPLKEDEFESLLSDLRALFAMIAGNLERNSDNAISDLKASLVTDAMYVRGKSFPYHQEGWLVRLTELAEDWLPANLGVRAADITRSIRWLLDSLQARINLVEAALRGVKNAGESFPLVLSSGLFRFDRPEPEIRRVLDLLSAEPGSKAAPRRLLPGCERATALDSPFLRINGEYYCFDLNALMDEIPSILDGWIRQRDASRYHGFTKRREKLAVKMALEALAGVFPGAQTRQNLFYELDGQRRETDGMVLLHDMAFVIEAKCGRLTQAARRGYDDRIVEDGKKLIGEAFDQCLRVAEYLKSSERPAFSDERGKPALTLERVPRKVYFINLVLDSLDVLATDLSEARKVGILAESQEWPWTVTLNDLRLVCDILDRPSLFLLYLNRRIRFNHFSDWFVVHDETDLLGYYLETGLFLETKPVKADFFIYQYDNKPLAVYFGACMQGKRSAVKPKPPFNVELVRLVESLERWDRPGILDLTTEMLGLDGSTQAKVVDNLRELSGRLATRRRAQRVLFVREGLGWSLWLTKEYGPEVRQFLLLDDLANKYERRLDRWTTLVCSYTGSRFCPIDLIVHEQPWKADALMEDQVASWRESKYNASGRSDVGRNEACPCGSGKKFKKCHGTQ